MRVALLFAVLAVLPAVALALPLTTAMATVYIYDAPEVSVSLVQSDGTLICSWDITDADEGDSFKADVIWSRDGKAYDTEFVDCGTLKHCAALGRPEPQAGEGWKCSVIVRDSYNSVGSGSAQFQLTPLSFFGGLLKSLFNLFKFS